MGALAKGPSKYLRYLSLFPQRFTFCFAYGSGVVKQAGDHASVKNMIDFIFVVDDSLVWHKQNIAWNTHHYSSLRWLGPAFITSFQERWGAKVYYNTLVPVEQSVIKYGVISQHDFVTDLLDWCDLYVAGRLHKPVEVVRHTSDSNVRLALRQNLHSAVHAALLQLPETFEEIDLYHTIAGLSYNGDFRMTIGEDRNKIYNIVEPQIEAFRELYAPILKSLQDFVDVPTVEGKKCRQNDSPEAKIYHLNRLPRVPQHIIARAWNRDIKRHILDTEESLHLLGHDLDCSQFVKNALKDIVWSSSIRQTIKGILTAGIMKSLRYGSKKIIKMLKSKRKLEVS